MFNTKKKHFKKALKDIERVLWETDFSRFKTIHVREQLRQEYDLAQEAIARTAAALKADEKNEQAKSDKDAAEKRLAQIKENLTVIDEQQLPAIDAKQQSMAEMIPLLKRFIANNC